MGAFTEKEVEYLRGQMLGRMATVGRDGSPHVMPVGFRLDAAAEAIEIGCSRVSRRSLLLTRAIRPRPIARSRSCN